MENPFYSLFLRERLRRTSFAAVAASPEEDLAIARKLTPSERDKKLIEGAKKEGEMVWYTNSGIENATRYIQAFRKNFPFINAQVWRAKTRQVTQRAISEANAGKYLVDVIKPSTDLLPPMLEKNLLGKYETPIRAIYPAHAKSVLLHQHELRVPRFWFQPAQAQPQGRAEDVGKNCCNPNGRARFFSTNPPRRSHGLARGLGQGQDRELR